MADRTDRGFPSRRSLLPAAAITGFLYLKPRTVFGSQANSAVEIGMLACDGRGVTQTQSEPGRDDAYRGEIRWQTAGVRFEKPRF